MNIIILGAGQVGGTLAENLVREDNDITVVDVNVERLRELQHKLDIQTVIGSASYPEVLQQAGGATADMLIAVTNSDEVNMIACRIAHTLFHTPTKIARIRSQSYLTHPELFKKNVIPIDLCISPEQEVTEYIQRLIEHPGALQVVSFANNRVKLVAVQPDRGGPLVGKKISELKAGIPHIDLRVAALFRANRSVPVTGSTCIEAGDELFFIATPEHIQGVLRAFGKMDNPYQRVLIAGGGNIGYGLAQALEANYQVKIIEHNPKRAGLLSERLYRSTIILGEVSDRELLRNENIEYTDIFCAVTNDDEANIIACLQAKRLGARKVIALVNRTNYIDLIEGSGIDIVLSPQQATIGSILTHLRQGDIVRV
ncbi:MAG: Trk system potassium transporter TrkA, partial [Proteobacteria bacterium]|nr:Trk system potassium transporter TrkA [Pseudomonadota bacterium]